MSDSPSSTTEDPDVVGDFIRNGMDQLIEEEFNEGNKGKGKAPKAEETEEPEESESDVEEIREDDEDESEEETEDEEEDNEDREEEDEEDEEDAGKDKGKPKPRSEIALAREEFKEVFKKHPGVEKNYFAGIEYGKMFESPKEAQELIETKEYIDQVLTHSLKGDPQPLLESIFEAAGENKDGFVRFTLSFLPTVHEIAPQLAEKILEQPILNLFAQLGSAAQSKGDEDLMTAVKLIMKELYGVEQVPQGKKIGKFIKDTRDVDAEREALNKTAEGDFYQSVENAVNPILEHDIEECLSDDLDVPDGIKAMLISEIKDAIYGQLKLDKNHMMVMSRIRKAARANRYNNEYKRRVAREVLNAARGIVAEVTDKVEKETFKSVKRNKDKAPKGESNRGANRHAATRTATKNNDENDFDPADIDFNQTSIRQALDFDPKKIHFKPKKKR